MSYSTVVMKIPILLYLFNSVFLGTNGEMCYEPKFTDSVFSCEDFENKMLDCSGLKLGSQKGDEGDDAAKLSGEIKTFVEIDSNIAIAVDIWKMLEMGNEFMYNSQVDFCSSLQNTDAPWYPVLEKLNIKSCPVSISTFEVQGVTVSLEAMKDVMCHDFCGEYQVQMAFMNKTEKVSCHVLELRIVETDCEEK